MWKAILFSGFLPKIKLALCGFMLITFSAQAETIYELDFSEASGSVKSWFETINWEFRKKIADMNLRFEDGKLRGQLSSSETEDMIKQNVISGGMAPKIDAALYCIKNGIESAQIINGTDPHSVIAELFTDQGIGTKIVL